MQSPQRTAAEALDRLLEASVVGSFTRVGYEVRSRMEHWDGLGDRDLSGRTIAITGATSGLGRAAAGRLAAMGADLVLVARDPAKAAVVVDELDALGSGSVRFEHADMGEPAQVRRAAESIADSVGSLDVLVHNAGALSNQYLTNSAGVEMTVASQVHGPFLLTALLLDSLRAAGPGRVITMSSGGMYTQALRVGGLEMGPDEYRGSVAYARAKRAQVALNEMWARRTAPDEVVFHALHPGWADTPGVSASLPLFRRLMGPALRTPEQGADTLVWLCADDAVVPHCSGLFWHDRRVRRTHALPSTPGDDESERLELWLACEAATGVHPHPASP